MDKRRGKLSALLAALSLLLTGCWDSIEVNDLDLSTMVILDKQGDEYSFTVEFPVIPSSTMGGASTPKDKYLSGSGASFVSARDSLEAKLEKPLYLGTVRTLVVTENAARYDLPEYLFRLREDTSYRQKVVLAITRETPGDLIRFDNETESPGGFSIDEMLATSVRSGRTYEKITAQYVEDILGRRGFVVHCIGLREGQLALTGYSVFCDARCVGFIPVEQAKGLIFLLADKPVWAYRVPFGGGYATVEVSGAGKKIAAAYRDGNASCSVHMDFRAEVQYFSQVQLFPLTGQALEEIKGNLESMLENEIRSAIEQSQNTYQCDYLQVCEAFRLGYPEIYGKLDWSREYPYVQMDVITRVELSVSHKMDLEPN